MRASRGTLAGLVIVASGVACWAAPAGAAPTPCVAPTITGTAGDDTISGTSGPDVIAALGGDDVVRGLGGDDVLCGGEGRDTLVGGAGADALYGGIDAQVPHSGTPPVFWGDTLEGGLGDDLLDPGSDDRHRGSLDTVTFAHSANGVTVDLGAGTAVGDGTDMVTAPVSTVVGSAYDDDLTGTDRPERFVGGRGADRLSGLGGGDTLRGGEERGDRAGNVLLGGDGNDVIDGARGPDLARGGAGNDTIQTSLGLDRQFGGPGDDDLGDIVEVGEDAQLLRGGSGRDQLGFLAFADAAHHLRWHATGRVDLPAGRTTGRFDGVTMSLETSGIDDLSTPVGDLWTVIGNRRANVIIAEGHTRLRAHAGGGNDELWGSAGADVLDGGLGYDVGHTFGGHDRIQSIEHLTG